MFLNALMLLGIGAAVVPWVLHLLSRSRYKNVDWGAMMFLESADSDPRQSSRVSQFLLLLVRTAVVALLAVALARPALLNPVPAPAKGQAVTAVILLDCSAAMNAEENGHPRMVLARGAAKQVLGRHRGDRVALELMGQKQPGADRQPTADLWDVARRIESAEPGPGVVDVAQSLRSALDVVDPRDDGAARARAAAGPKPFVDFYVITGRQASAWRGVDAAFRDDFRQRLRQAGVPCRLFFVPVGGTEADEVAVESINLLNPPAVVNQPADLEIQVRNYDTKVRWANLPLTVTTAGPERAADRGPERGDRGHLKVSEQNINLAPDVTATFHATATFRTPGTHVVSATIKGAAGATGGAAPAGPGEGRFDWAVEVREPTRVLIVGGESPDPDATGSAPSKAPGHAAGGNAIGNPATAAECLRLALAPFKAAGQPGADPCTVDVVSADAWTGSGFRLPAASNASGKGGPSGQGDPSRETGEREVKLGDYQVVILSDVERLAPQQAVALKQFVYDGGGLLVAPGPLSRPDDYNATLYRGGEGILPAALGEPTAADGSEQTALSGSDLNHPVFRFLASRPDLALSVSVARYFPVTARAPGAQPLAQYASGDPFLIENTAGKGRVLLMTTSLGTDWTNLPLSSFYLPFAQSAVRYLADAAPLHLNLHPGQPIEVPLDDPAFAGGTGAGAGTGASPAVMVIPPEGPQRAAEVLSSGERTVARFTETDVPGVYVVRVTGTAKPSTLAFVVRPPAEDSNPSPLPQERWDWLAREVGFEKLDPAEHPIDASPAADSGRRELWRWALAGVLLLAVTEVAVARAASRQAP